MIRFFPIAALVLCAVLLHGQRAAAGPLPGGWDVRNGISFGGSLAWAGGGTLEHAFVPGIDITYVHRIRAPLFFWGATGARLWTGSAGTAGIPYLEAGLTIMFLTIGGGVGLGIGEDAPPASAHILVGIPIPLYVPRKGRLFYLEPYYRPTFDVSGESFPVAHEVGVFIKWFFMIGSRISPEAPDSAPRQP